MVGVLVVALVGALVMVVAKPGTLFSEWYSIACPVDANGDGVLDLVGESARPGAESWKLTIVDGRNGSVLWRSASDYVPQDMVLCLGHNAFGVAFPDAHLTVFDPRSHKSRWSAPLPDKVAAYGIEGDCLQLETLDQKQQSVGLRDGKPRRCSARTENAWAAPGYGNEASMMELDAGNVAYRLQAKTQGTAFLTVSAQRGDQTLWETRLRYAAVGRDLYFARAPRMLLVYGVDPARDDTGVIIGIDPDSGRVRYESAQGARWSVHFARTFLFNGRYLVTTWGYGLHAFDPTTGKKAWHIGGR